VTAVAKWTEYDRRNAPKWGVDLYAAAPPGCDRGRRRRIHWTPRARQIGEWLALLLALLAFWSLFLFCGWLATYHRLWVLPVALTIVLTFAVVSVAVWRHGRASRKGPTKDA
jgi:hypothetical protein